MSYGLSERITNSRRDDHSYSQFFININRKISYVPLGATGVSLFYLFQKFVFFPLIDFVNPALLSRNHYVKYIKERGAYETLILLVPVIGNILFYRLNRERKKDDITLFKRSLFPQSDLKAKILFESLSSSQINEIKTFINSFESISDESYAMSYLREALKNPATLCEDKKNEIFQNLANINKIVGDSRVEIAEISKDEMREIFLGFGETEELFLRFMDQMWKFSDLKNSLEACYSLLNSDKAIIKNFLINLKNFGYPKNDFAFLKHLPNHQLEGRVLDADELRAAQIIFQFDEKSKEEIEPILTSLKGFTPSQTNSSSYLKLITYLGFIQQERNRDAIIKKIVSLFDFRKNFTPAVRIELIAVMNSFFDHSYLGRLFNPSNRQSLEEPNQMMCEKLEKFLDFFIALKESQEISSSNNPLYPDDPKISLNLINEMCRFINSQGHVDFFPIYLALIPLTVGDDWKLVVRAFSGVVRQYMSHDRYLATKESLNNLSNVNKKDLILLFKTNKLNFDSKPIYPGILERMTEQVTLHALELFSKMEHEEVEAFIEALPNLPFIQDKLFYKEELDIAYQIFLLTKEERDDLKPISQHFRSDFYRIDFFRDFRSEFCTKHHLGLLSNLKLISPGKFKTDLIKKLAPLFESHVGVKDLKKTTDLIIKKLSDPKNDRSSIEKRIFEIIDEIQNYKSHLKGKYTIEEKNGAIAPFFHEFEKIPEPKFEELTTILDALIPYVPKYWVSHLLLALKKLPEEEFHNFLIKFYERTDQDFENKKILIPFNFVSKFNQIQSKEFRENLLDFILTVFGESSFLRGNYLFLYVFREHLSKNNNSILAEKYQKLVKSPKINLTELNAILDSLHSFFQDKEPYSKTDLLGEFSEILPLELKIKIFIPHELELIKRSLKEAVSKTRSITWFAKKGKEHIANNKKINTELDEFFENFEKIDTGQRTGQRTQCEIKEMLLKGIYQSLGIKLADFQQTKFKELQEPSELEIFKGIFDIIKLQIL